MIWFVAVDLKQIHEQGRKFSWPRPPACLCCNNWQVWGHGYVERYFDGFAAALPLKCYHCPACGCVITLRPKSHFTKFIPAKKLFETISFTDYRPADGRRRHCLDPVFGIGFSI